MDDPDPASRSSGDASAAPSRRHAPLVAVVVLAVVVFGGAAVAGVLAAHDAPVPAPTRAAVAPGRRAPSPSTPPAQPSPSEAPSQQASPTPRRSRAEPSPARPAGKAADFSALAEEVSQVRGLEAQRRLRARVVGEQALADKISELAFNETDRDEVEADERLLVALRLAPADLDLAGLLEDLYREQVLGVYVPKEKTLYVRNSAGELSAYAELIAAHEVTHALQDQSFDLVRLQRHDDEDADARMAAMALVEGDAVLTQQLWQQRFQSAEEQAQVQAEAAQDGSDVLQRTPSYLREVLFFPYGQGGAFVAQLYRDGGYDAVDDAFADPPTTTEQILHPDKYRAGEAAVGVTVTGSPGAGWGAQQTYTLGEFDVNELFSPLGGSTADDAAEGWAGGEVRSFGRRGRTAVGLALAFDSADDADEACRALPDWYRAVADAEAVGRRLLQGDRDHLAYSCDGLQVRAGLAPRPATARRLARP